MEQRGPRTALEPCAWALQVEPQDTMAGEGPVTLLKPFSGSDQRVCLPRRKNSLLRGTHACAKRQAMPYRSTSVRAQKCKGLWSARTGGVGGRAAVQRQCSPHSRRGQEAPKPISPCI